MGSSLRRALAVLLVLSGVQGCIASSEESDASEGALVGVVDETIQPHSILRMRVGNGTGKSERILDLFASSSLSTHWAERGNEAVILEVRADERLIGHLALHQGSDAFHYRMHLGEHGEEATLSLRISPMTAPRAQLAHVRIRSAKVEVPTHEQLTAIRHAPIFHWPVQKRFDDAPLGLGYSGVRNEYVAIYTNENGGTVQLCGGGAKGLQAEIARWGRSVDIERVYRPSTEPTFFRCTGETKTSDVKVRFEGAHPRLFYGDGHNRLFESRSGYGETCGKAKPERTDGEILGFGEKAANYTDEASTVVFRPVPEDLDAIGYDRFTGRAESMMNTYYPWLYRLSSNEAAREMQRVAPMVGEVDQYLYADLRFSGNDGVGDGLCREATGGFRPIITLTSGAKVEGPIVTKSSSSSGDTWKRVAIQFPRETRVEDVRSISLKALEGEAFAGTEIGDVFFVRPVGKNNAGIAYVSKGVKPVFQYVDALSEGCSDGNKTIAGSTFRCVKEEALIPFD